MMCHMAESLARLGKAGRLVIPAEFRRALGVGPGSEVVLNLDEQGLHIYPADRALRRAQELVRRYVEPGRSLAEELIRERREEAERE